VTDHHATTLFVYHPATPSPTALRAPVKQYQANNPTVFTVSYAEGLAGCWDIDMGGWCVGGGARERVLNWPLCWCLNAA